MDKNFNILFHTTELYCESGNFTEEIHNKMEEYGIDLDADKEYIHTESTMEELKERVKIQDTILKKVRQKKN